MRGRLVVVGGHSRHVGKTCMVNAILRETPEMNWHAVKISNHPHAPRPLSTDNLLRLADAEIADGIATLAAALDAGRNVLVESNRIVRHLASDLVVFAVDPSNLDWKLSSAACLDRADVLVFSGDGPMPPEIHRLRRILPAFRLAAWTETPLGFREWIRGRLEKEVSAHEIPSADLLVAGVTGRCAIAGGTPQVGQRHGPGFHPYAVGSLELV